MNTACVFCLGSGWTCGECRRRCGDKSHEQVRCQHCDGSGRSVPAVSTYDRLTAMLGTPSKRASWRRVCVDVRGAA
jgi:hypothetical protein